MKLSLKSALQLDMVGAFFSSLLTGILLPLLEEQLSIPAEMCYKLVPFPILLFTYGIYNYFQSESNFRKTVKYLAIGNSIYILYSLLIASTYHSHLTQLSWAYLIGEIIVILLVIYIEVRAVLYNTGKH